MTPEIKTPWDEFWSSMAVYYTNPTPETTGMCRQLRYFVKKLETTKETKKELFDLINGVIDEACGPTRGYYADFSTEGFEKRVQLAEFMKTVEPWDKPKCYVFRGHGSVCKNEQWCWFEPTKEIHGDEYAEWTGPYQSHHEASIAAK